MEDDDEPSTPAERASARLDAWIAARLYRQIGLALIALAFAAGIVWFKVSN